MSEYEDAIDKMCWSYSRLTSFEHCKYEFYLNYIVHDDGEYLSESNFYAEVGSYVHDILRQIFIGELNEDDAAQYYIDHFDENVFYWVKKATMEKTFESCAEYFSDVDFSWLKNFEILGVEMKNTFKIYDYDFVGIIDLLLRDKRDGKIVLIDNKSSDYPFKLDGKVKKKCEKNFSDYKKQMYLYCKAVFEKYGEYPKEIVWNHFKDGGKFARIPFSGEEYNEAINWFLKTIEEIRQEKDFAPTLDFFYCTRLCDFRHSCEYCEQEFGGAAP